jgi:alditol oxidase
MKNWAGNLTYRAAQLLEPRSVDQLRELVAASPRLRPIGTRHSFNDIADTTGALLSLRALPRRLELHPRQRTVTVDGGATYGEICGRLHAAGLALSNLPSLPHISVAGASATGTHGSGGRLPILAAEVVAMELVLANGELRRVPEGPVDAGAPAIPLDAASVSLGALGVITEMTFRVEPTFDIRQDVFEGLPAEAFGAAFEDVTALAESASFFTTWRDATIDQVWLKRRVDPDGGPAPSPTLHGAMPATRELHPIRELSAEACTPQLGAPGPWHERLPHFRLSHVPSSGAELQSEYFVSMSDAGAAFAALQSVREELAPVVQVSEVRTIAADDIWLSPAYRRATAAFHFTWIADLARVQPVLRIVERVLDPFQPRAHWAKLAALPPRVISERHPRLGAFAELASACDPTGKLRNRRLEELFAAA